MGFAHRKKEKKNTNVYERIEKLQKKRKNIKILTQIR